MHIKSPQRTRKIRNLTLIGGFVGFCLGLVLHSINGYWYGAILFTIFGAAIAGATAYLLDDNVGMD